MAEVALLVIAIDLTLLSAMAIVYTYRASRAAEAMERTARRMEKFLDAMVDVGDDVRRVSRELTTVAVAVGLSRRARATLAGAKAAVTAFRHHSNGADSPRERSSVR